MPDKICLMIQEFTNARQNMFNNSRINNVLWRNQHFVQYMAHLNRLSNFCTGKKARFLTQQTMLLALALAKGVLLAKLRATGRMYKVATLHSTIAQVHRRHLAPCAAVLRREAEQVDNLDAFIAPGYMLAYLSFQPFFFLRGNGNS